MKPHIHAELIKQWADGAQIQGFCDVTKEWDDFDYPGWFPDVKYRVKPNIVDDVISRLEIEVSNYGCSMDRTFLSAFKYVLKKYDITPKE